MTRTAARRVSIAAAIAVAATTFAPAGAALGAPAHQSTPERRAASVQLARRASPVTVNCGWVTCSAYVSRSATKSIAGRLQRYQNASSGAIGVAAGAACAATGIGGVVAGVCGAVGIIYGGFAVDQFVHAANTNACVRFRYVRTPHPPYYSAPLIYVDRSKYCH
ncbi:hypothetical protein AB0M02_15415 [Actinoplanes sp. NPDC051861]|uniref:hypothetical protein n=1 Tax=Actinoplanes sp. NPDC051861 TaxID=3155170 RepID=UPI00344307EE